MALKQWLKDLPSDEGDKVPEGFAPLVDFLAKKRAAKKGLLDKKQKAESVLRKEKIKMYQKIKNMF